MNQQLKVAAVALFAFALTACSGVGSSIPGPMHNPAQMQSISVNHGLDLSHAHVMRTRSSQAPFISPDLLLSYGGGPVEKKAKVYVVFWGYGKTAGDPSGVKPYLKAFLNGVGGSSWMNIDHQYYQIVAGVKEHIQNNTGMLLGTWVDDTNSEPLLPTDSQIQTEAGRLMAHFGFLRDASYVVATSHLHNSSGFGTQYCAYHQATSQGGHIIAYTNLPYIPDAGYNCGAGFINTPGLLDGVSVVEGHELAESQTDPQPFSGWNSSQGEIGDLCAWLNPPAADITLTTGTFAVQGLWSNANSGTNKCVIQYP